MNDCYRANSESREPVNRNQFDDLQFRIEDLLAVQDERLVDAVNSMSLGNPGPNTVFT